ncbi:metallophosphoesterase family protein [Caenispirillum bisanense]
MPTTVAVRYAEAMTVFFTSDTHFGHAGALGLLGRRFDSVKAMNAVMIARWQATVGPDDEVWHLGDFALTLAPAARAEILDALPGRKHLVAGNNDDADTLALPGWASVQSYAELTVDDTPLVLCHYPFRTWNGISRGALNLHGHSHGRLEPMARQMDVGVDVFDFRPVTLAEIRAALRRRRRRRQAEGDADAAGADGKRGAAR